MAEYYDPFAAQEGQPTPMFAMSAMPAFSPMLGGGQPTRFTGPFNFNTGMGNNGMSAMLTQFMPFLVSQLAGKGHMPAQFFPEQGFYDQMRAQEFFMANQQARTMASASDTAAMTRTFGGFTRMMNKGKPITEAQRIRNEGWANMTSQMMPMLTQFIGPDMVDTLHGSRGSAAIFASELHSALRTSLDPVTGGVGMSGVSAGNISRGVYENLFSDKNYNPAALRGLSAGQAGMLAKELQTRGLLGVPLGSMGIEERRAALPKTLSDDTYKRIAEDTTEIKDLGNAVTDADLKAATQRVRDTHTKLKSAAPGTYTEEDLLNEDKLPGGADIMRAADANKVSKRLKDMSGAVKAMREIFGDAGNPNAPMKEIIDGLQQLTQGGMSTMTPQALEMTVRKTQAIAKQTGMSVEGIMALTNTNTQIGDALGLDRKYSVTNAQQTALFASTAANVLHLDSGVYGQSTVEGLAAADAQVRMAATASPAANQMRAAIRMMEEGVIKPDQLKPNSRLKKYIDAIKNGDSKFEFRMNEGDYVAMFEESGVGEGITSQLLWDTGGNQGFGDKYNIPGLVRGQSLRRDAIANQYGPAVQSAMNRATAEGTEALRAKGILTSDEAVQGLMLDLGRGFANDFLDMDAATANDPKLRQKVLGEKMRANTIANLRKQMIGASDAEVASAADLFLEKSGGAGSLSALGYSAINLGAADDVNAKTAMGFYNLYGAASEKAMLLADRRAYYDARMSKAYSGLGTAGPTARLMDMLQQNTTGGINQDQLLKLLGQVGIDKKNFADPKNAFMASLGLMNANKKLNLSNDADLAQFNLNADIAGGLNFGGDEARRILDETNADGTPRVKDPKMREMLEKAVTNPDMLKEALEASPLLGSSVQQEEMASTAKAGADALRRVKSVGAIGKDGPTKLDTRTTAAVNKFMTQSTGRAQQLMGDEWAMRHLGTGGLADVKSVLTANAELEAMAKLKGVDVATLLTGENSAEARKLFDANEAMMQNLSKRFEAGKNEKLSPDELADLKHSIAFDEKYQTDEARAEAAMESLLGSTAKERRGLLEDPLAGDPLLELMKTGRGESVHRAAKAREDILALGIKYHVFDNKTAESVDQLSAKEVAEATTRLSDAKDMSADDKAQFDILRKAAKPLEGLDKLEGLDIDALTSTIEAMTVAAAPGTKAEEAITMNVTGSFTEEESGRVLTIKGTSDAMSASLFKTAGVS